MRVLVLDEEIPYPTDTGKKTRTFNLISRLAKRHEIDYVCYVDPAELDVIKKFQKFGVNVYPVIQQKSKNNLKRFYLKLFLNMFSNLPFIIYQYYTQAYQAKVNSLMQTKLYDLIHCEISLYSIFLSNKKVQVPSVGICHNVEAEIWKRYFLNETNIFKKIFILSQWKRISAFEAQYLQKFTTCIAVSDRDANYLRKNYGVYNVEIVPNGVDIDYFHPTSIRFKKYNIVFTGSMDWRPNQDAIKFFLKNIWHLVLKEVPSATFTVVGRNPPQWLYKLANRYKGVELTGTVNDVRPYINRAHLFVVPLRIGGGSRLKILEAMASGKAVISTVIGAEGLEVKHGENIFLEDSPYGFAKRIIQLFKNDIIRKKLEKKGRELVEKNYNWEILANKMDKIWRKVACGM